MTGFFDASVLIPVFYPEHPHHSASLQRLTGFDSSTGYCSAHGLVEVYSTLTRMPGKAGASSDEAIAFVQRIRNRLSIVTLDAAEYENTLLEASALGIRGGTVYDAIHAACALKCGADVIYTWNVRHYVLCGPEVARRVSTP